MMKTIRKLLLLLCLQILLPVHVAYADIGPKPTMDFQFNQELLGEPITITSGILYECDQPDCADSSPLEEAGPQGLYCQADRCDATAYGFAQYHRLEIEFSDGQTRRSNIFETAGFNSTYTVTVRQEDLLVESQFTLDVFPRNAAILIACVCALAGFGFLAVLVFFLRRRAAKT